MATPHPHGLVSTLEDRFRELETEFHKAYWDSQVRATPETERRRAELELQLRRAKGDPQALEEVTAALDLATHDPILRRQLEVLELSLAGNQMNDSQRARLVEVSSSVESDFAAYRPEVDGRRLSDNDVEEILKWSDDEDLRRNAWEGSKEIGPVVAERVRELARIRNEVARDRGFADYFEMSLALSELEEGWLFQTLTTLEELTDAPFRTWKSELDAKLADRFATTALYPWHYADPFFQSLPPQGKVDLDAVVRGRGAPSLAERTFSMWGIDLSGVMSASDLYPRDKKSQHAFCLSVDRERDVRILANVVPGERWVEVMLHESGHAAYDVSIDLDLPYLLRRPAHTFVTEAIALLCGRLIRDLQWLVQIAHIPEAELEPLAPALASSTAAGNLVFARWGLVVVHFERDFYADPEADLDSRWWELVERFQLITPPPERNSGWWASKIHVATAPVYYQNYLLGEILASQLRRTCERECGGLVGVRDAGRLLAERVFKIGACMRWDALIEQATAVPLSARDFAEGLSA